MSKPPMPAPKKINVLDADLPNPKDLIAASSTVASTVSAAINSAEAHTDLGVEAHNMLGTMASLEADASPKDTDVIISVLDATAHLMGAPIEPVLEGNSSASTAPVVEGESSGAAEPNTFNVRLYHYIVDNGEYVSLFPAESPELMDEMLEHGMVREYRSAHQIKHNIKDKELEHRALALFHGEVSARAELTRRGFGRNW